MFKRTKTKVELSNDIPYYSKFSLSLTICFLLLWIVGNAKAEGTILSPDDINELIPSIIEAETEQFVNLKIKTIGYIEIKSNLLDPCEPWVPTEAGWSCTCYIRGSDHEVKSIDFNNLVFKLPEGPSPYLSERFSVSYDGKIGKYISHKKGSLKKERPNKRGIILSRPPKQLKSTIARTATGEKFLVSRFFEGSSDDKLKLSRLFQAATTEEAVEANAFEVKIINFQGVECIKLSSKNQKWGHEAWWFDPSRGFSLIGYERANIRDDKEILISRINVNKMKKISSSFWWPTEVISIEPVLPIKEGKLIYQRTIYKVSDILVNNPNFEKHFSQNPFPVGYKIDDRITNRVYTVENNTQ